ncbi:hypothetical protein [Pseudomonas oryzihabitans]|nr:hypothetical protein [Pseudomonas oryzihabitans]
MHNEVRRMSLLSYVQAFFPSNFEVTLRRSLKDQDYRVLTVRDSITGNDAAYEGSALSILDICSMGSIAEDLCGRLSDQAAGRQKVMR